MTSVFNNDVGKKGALQIVRTPRTIAIWNFGMQTILGLHAQDWIEGEFVVGEVDNFCPLFRQLNRGDQMPNGLIKRARIRISDKIKPGGGLFYVGRQFDPVLEPDSEPEYRIHRQKKLWNGRLFATPNGCESLVAISPNSWHRITGTKLEHGEICRVQMSVEILK